MSAVSTWRLTQRVRSTSGTISTRPGSRAPRSRPSRNTTTRWYSRTMRIAAAASSNTIPPTTISASQSMATARYFFASGRFSDRPALWTTLRRKSYCVSTRRSAMSIAASTMSWRFDVQLSVRQRAVDRVHELADGLDRGALALLDRLEHLVGQIRRALDLCLGRRHPILPFPGPSPGRVQGRP